MSRTKLEVADVLRRHGEAFRAHNAGHLDRSARRVMGAIRACRTAALGGHVARCNDCGHTAISYNSCRNRHCPKCQAGAARAWLEARAADLLPVQYFHVVFTLPAPVAAIAFQNKAVVYALLFEAAAETLKTIAADHKHLAAEIGATMVLHTWGQTLTHHPHVHCIVPGGGISADGKRWIACRPGFFLPVRVLSRLYRRLFLDKLRAAHRAGRLRFFNELAPLAATTAFNAHIAPLRRTEWIVYAKRPFAGPQAVLAYPRFVVKKHAGRRLHYDLRLEVGAVFVKSRFCRYRANLLFAMTLTRPCLCNDMSASTFPNGENPERNRVWLRGGPSGSQGRTMADLFEGIRNLACGSFRICKFNLRAVPRAALPGVALPRRRLCDDPARRIVGVR